MWFKYFSFSVVLAILGIFIFSFAYFTGQSSFKGDIYETQETNNDNFAIKITAYHEAGIYMTGAYFTYASAPVGSDNWQVFKTYRTDDAVSISLSNTHFLNNQTAYIYTSNEFLVTTDGGKNWVEWIPILNKVGENKDFHWSISEIDINERGEGSAILERYDFSLQKTISAEALTKDYGLNWVAKN